MHVCFATEELAPVTTGGIGQVIATTARLLVEQGHVVSLVLAPLGEIAADAMLPGYFRDTHVVQPSDAARSLRRALGDARARHLAIARSVHLVHASLAIDVLEVPDYHGVGAMTVGAARLGLPGFRSLVSAVRLHGTSEIVRTIEGRPGTRESRAIERRERRGLAWADIWLAPSPEVGADYRAYYGRPQMPLLTAPLPVSIPVQQRHPRAAAAPGGGRVLFYGRLQTVKGAEAFVQAALEVLRVRQSARFTMAGADVAVAGGGMMRSVLEAMLPRDVRDAFLFLGRVEQKDLRDLVLRHDVAVVPSLSETFCLAAHELNAIGIPLVLRRLPAFSAYFADNKTGRLFERDDELPRAILDVLDGAAIGWEWNAPAIAKEAANVGALYERVVSTARGA